MFLNHVFNCNFCNSENKVKIDFDDRGTLQMKKGDELSYTCFSCHKKDKIHINKITAKSNKIILLISVFISILSLILTFKSGFIAYASLIFPILVYTYLKSLEDNFNSYRIKTK
ncbi:hypothetical protein [uncultured Flavobacterium sp.]|uniref:hypothetical protein n=1 Tax=uncultured Flavobacterium sp. TaxID=165435 RepID=UPI0030EE82D4|tara:strand:- start:321397 stop:321738 length:342 start_codon:yes stop_codon:yes gene_type:complete